MRQEFEVGGGRTDAKLETEHDMDQRVSAKVLNTTMRIWGLNQGPRELSNPAVLKHYT